MEPQRRLESSTFEDLAQKNTPGFLPVLIDIKHQGIVWNYPESTDEEVLKYRQQDGHLRLINDVRGVMYKGNDSSIHYYEPCSFKVKLGKEDGKTKSNASITISCVDARIIEIIRSIEEDLTCRVVGMYTKVAAGEDSETGETKYNYAFSKLYGKEFEMSSVTYGLTSAQWELNPDSIMELNIPRDMGSAFRLPSVNEE